jgi:hypothetical protein
MVGEAKVSLRAYSNGAREIKDGTATFGAADRVARRGPDGEKRPADAPDSRREPRARS